GDGSDGAGSDGAGSLPSVAGAGSGVGSGSVAVGGAPVGIVVSEGLPDGSFGTLSSGGAGTGAGAKGGVVCVWIGSSDFRATFLWMRLDLRSSFFRRSGSFVSSRPRTHTRTSGCPYDAAMPSM